MNHHVITPAQYQEYVRLQALFERSALDYLVVDLQGSVGADGMPEQIAVCSASTGNTSSPTVYAKVDVNRPENSAADDK